jgi:hypothetical protein
MMLSRKLRISFGDIIKLLIGKKVLIKNPFGNDKVYTIQKGEKTYFAK